MREGAASAAPALSRQDRQTDSQPRLCLCGLSYHLLLREGSSQLIQTLPLQREGVGIAEQPVTVSLVGVCAQKEEEFSKTGLTTTPARQHRGSATGTGSGGAEDGDTPR